MNQRLDYFFVGATGFEPATACSQNRSATGLRYTPPLSDDVCKGNALFPIYKKKLVAVCNALQKSGDIAYCGY